MTTLRSLGRSVAVLFACEGADVVFTQLPEEVADAAEKVRAIEESSRRALALEGDLLKPKFCHSVVESTVREFGKLDILVSKADFHITGQVMTLLGGSTTAAVRPRLPCDAKRTGAESDPNVAPIRFTCGA
jgi:NAD(P)-dependent dehydrogenase (short-subunit alcohol dehydrogenase family)